MRLKNYSILLAFIFIVCFLQAGNTYSARLSEGKKVASPQQKTRKIDRSSINKSDAKVLPQAASTDDEDKKPDKDDSSLVSIDFDNVDIMNLINFISDLTKKNFIVNEKVKGKVTVISPTKVTIDEAYRTFESVLEVHGFTTVPAGSSIKIEPIKDATKKDIETRLGDTIIGKKDRVITQIIPLKYATPSDLKNVLNGFSSGLVYYDQTGMLIVTDVQSNISHLLKIIKAIDIPGTGEEITVVQLHKASAQTMGPKLKTIFTAVTSGPAKKSSKEPKITIEPDERTNSLIIVASEIDTLKIKQLIDILDKDTEGQGDIHVYYLQNADAEELSKTLNDIPRDNKQAGQKGPAAASVLTKDTQISFDKATNSLIITAQKDEYEILEEVIKKLDQPRSMVYIEALILEVSTKKDNEIGVQWQAGDEGNSAIVYGASNPGVNNFPSIDTSTGGVSVPTGMTFGVIGDMIKIGELEFADLGAVFRAFSSDSDVQIHSKPMITTLDNEEAELKVTDNVPYIQRRDQSQNSSNYAGFTNYDFKEVGVKLTITPQINKERFVRLKIEQEVSQVLSFDEAGQPTTFARSAKTTVRLKDGQTLVIGGLIDKKDNRTNYRVPLLGRIPILGWLFRSRTDKTDNKNMYIFLTPHIMENVEEANEISEAKKAHIDTIKENVIRMHNNGKLPEDMRRVEMGNDYLQLNDYEKALKYYNKALDKNPYNPYAIYYIGYIHQIQGEPEKAIEMYEKLIIMDTPDRALESPDPLLAGRKLTDMAKDNLKFLKVDE